MSLTGEEDQRETAGGRRVSIIHWEVTETQDKCLSSAEAPSGDGSRAYPSSHTQAHILSFSGGKKSSHHSPVMGKNLITSSVTEESIVSVTAVVQRPLSFQLPLQGRGRWFGNSGKIFRREFSVKILKLPEIPSAF